MTHILPASTVRILPSGDVEVDVSYLLDNIEIKKVVAHYKPGELLSAMEWKDIKAFIDEVKISTYDP